MENYKLVWSDEFDYEGRPDPNKWTFETGGDGWGNREEQFYTDNLENAYVKDGVLTIVAKKEDYKGNYYTSAKLTTYQKQSWTYGKIAVRAKLPKGKGTWPAIWMLSEASKEGRDWPLCGEIDIMEHVGKDQDMIHFSLHSEKNNHMTKTEVTNSKRSIDVSDKFYEYMMEWTPDYIEFYVDGNSIVRFNKGNKQGEEEWPFDQPFYLILNLAIGGFWGGEVDASIFPQKLEVDYVRAYEKQAI